MIGDINDLLAGDIINMFDEDDYYYSHQGTARVLTDFNSEKMRKECEDRSYVEWLVDNGYIELLDLKILVI